jgi:hypothetical protein
MDPQLTAPFQARSLAIEVKAGISLSQGMVFRDDR